MNKIIGILILAVSSLYFANSFAKTPRIEDNIAVAGCINKYKDQNIECLDDVIHKSEDQLDKAYSSKLNEIKNTSPDEWWMGDKQQKTEVINSFIANQKKWIEYRDSYCGVALWPYQNSDHLGEVKTSCELNMNKRRIEEINLIHTPSEMESGTP